MNAALTEINIHPDNPGYADLHLSGILDINNAELIHFQLADSLSKFEFIDLMIDEPEKIDISFIQLLVAFKRSARDRGRNVRISAKLNEEQRVLLLNAGIDPGFEQL